MTGGVGVVPRLAPSSNLRMGHIPIGALQPEDPDRSALAGMAHGNQPPPQATRVSTGPDGSPTHSGLIGSDSRGLHD